MTFIAQRLDRIAASPTLAMTKLSFELKAQGRNIITLSQGEPDNHTEPHVSEAGIQAIRANRTKYTAVDGMPEFKAAIAEKFRRDNGLDFKSDQIIVSSASKTILFNAALAIVNPGDEVIIPSPYWVSYPDIARVAEGKPVYVACHQENGFRMRPQDLEAAITPRTRMLILCSPCNPTGAVYRVEDLIGLGEVLERHPQVFVVVDEIYEHLVYDGLKSPSLAACAPQLAGRILTVNGMSKGYAMTGWRLGFAGGPREVIKAISTMQSQNTSSPNEISQIAAIEALNGPQQFIERNKALFQERRDLAVSMLNAIPGLHCVTPEGAFYIFCSCEGVIGKSTAQGKRIETDGDFVFALLDQEGVAAVQGEAFGMSPFFRISYALSIDTMREALTRIGRFCASLS
jgi:aspartate aminotransferase